MDHTATSWQKEIYLNGFAGLRSKIPVDFARLEKEAKRCMSRQAYAYIAGGAGFESTMQSNREAFDRYKIVPRMLTNVGERDTSISLFGQKLPAPLLISPVGVLEMVHAEADLAVARAARSVALPYIFSNQASYPMEDCAADGK